MPRTFNINHRSGFVPLNAKESDVDVIEVASAYGTDIQPGDPLLGVTAGGVQRTPAGSAAGAATDGITAVCLEIVQYKDPAGFVRRNADYLPSGTTWSAHHERSLLKVVFVNDNMRFAAKANAAVANIATARALRFANADHAYSGADTGLGIAGGVINIATVNTTNTLQWRIIGSHIDMPFNDPTLTGFQLVVIPNLIYALPMIGNPAAGAAAGSTGI